MYEVVNEQKDFHVLHSTRFFGTLVFYLVWFKKVDNLLAYLLQNKNLNDCCLVIRVYSIVNGQVNDQLHSKITQQADQLISQLDLVKVRNFFFSFLSIQIFNIFI